MDHGNKDARPPPWRNRQDGAHRRRIVIQRRSALHLLWAMPLVFVVSLPALAIARLSWCPWGGCRSWQGPYPADTGTAITACIAAAVAMTLALALIPWLRPRTIRIALALLTGACWGLVIALIAHEL
ncbi:MULTISPECIES: hypothetical protein [unclassified Cryobacterium]|uniref:hypothetical protein n=1 Tax=unclassified Cryobacterium TaxID=2649013 RepID=UPI00106920DF|nr:MULTISPECIES: hypothetical protein [unclassified Cryobacterium]TFC53403.1 hypothetical protein E3O68_11640 [Cryobacterium sp. TMB3-1-2]TFC69068.1 hypothetical protein E3T21_12625 [Cryobacterium sp. TMB3-15]TFC76132.1 hypothetical protein E3T22_09190 [Cryobacterium sp. TMB3-10]TFD43863.1 hypothetical protein E3T58_05690 [Cryobacterium sp. TMB3-12]